MPQPVKDDPCRITRSRYVTRQLPLSLALLWLLYLLAPICLPPRRAEAQDVRDNAPHGVTASVLAPGATITREIAGGEVQLFSVELSANQYLHLSVDRRDSNLTLTIHGPDGQSSVAYTGQKHREIEAALVAEMPGAYRLEVRSLEKNSTGRRYELKAGKLRRARDHDFKTLAAAKLTAEASRLRAECVKDSLLGAAAGFMEARAAWLAAGERRPAIDALTAAAEVHFTLGDYRQALQLYDTATAESRRVGDRYRELEALSAAAATHSYLGHNSLAQRLLQTVIGYYGQRVDAAGPPRDKRLLAEALNNMGEVYHAKGIPHKALGYYQWSLSLWSETGDRRGEALARLNLGHTLISSGDMASTATEFERALELARATDDRTVEARALTAIGMTHSSRGLEQAALELHLQALEIARRVGDRQSEAIALNGLSVTYERFGKRHVALDYYEQALRLFLMNESLDFAAGAEYRIGRVHRLMGDTQSALAHYRESISLSRRADKKRIEAYALTDIATIYRDSFAYSEALTQYQKVLRLYRQVGDRRGQSIVLSNLGDLASKRGDQREALNFYEQALKLTVVSGDRETEASILYNAAVAARDSGDLAAALEYVERSVRLIDTLRTYVAGPALRSSYVASVYKHYGLYVDLLMRLDRERPGEHYAANALLASERARARSLLETLHENDVDIRRGVEPELLKRERELQRLLRVKAQRMQFSSTAQTKAEAADAARELRGLTAEYEVVQARIRERKLRAATPSQPQPITLEDIQAELRGEETILLEYLLGDERSYLWVVTADSLDSYELPGRAVLEAKAREVYGLLTSRQTDGRIDAAYQAHVAASDEHYEEKALALSRMLLGQVGSRLRGQRLLVVAEGVLQYIPFEALPLPDAEPPPQTDGPAPRERPLLVSRHEIISLPSVSTLITLRRERSQDNSAPGLVAILADPVYEARDQRVTKVEPVLARAAETDAPVRRALRGLDRFNTAEGIPRLFHTSDEADAIMSLAPAGQAMLAKGFEANRETALSARLGQYQIVHFATHGLVNSENPELSGIILSLVDQEGRPTDGFLQLHDIYDLSLPAELVVLSACNTGLGEDVKGEGLVGLTRVFLHSGSKSVVASLWKVDDAATAELMSHFYRAMLEEGMTPAAALRVAKEQMRRQKRWQAPYYWAGFVVQGEYRQRIKTVYGPSVAGLSIILAALSSCVGLFVLLRLWGGFRYRSRRREAAASGR